MLLLPIPSLLGGLCCVPCVYSILAAVVTPASTDIMDAPHILSQSAIAQPPLSKPDVAMTESHALAPSASPPLASPASSHLALVPLLDLKSKPKLGDVGCRR